MLLHNSSVTVLQNIVLGLDNDTLLPLVLNKQQNSVVDTCTYINIFCCNIWKTLTNCQNFSLCGDIIGHGILKIYYLDNQFNLITTDVFEIKTETKTHSEWRLNESAHYTYFEWQANTLNLSNFYYQAENKKINQVKILLVVPTYNRLQDLNNVVATYLDAIEHNPEFQTHSTLYIVNNNNYEISFPSQNIIVENTFKNIGGSASFTKGAKFAEQNNYTHTLFMDDDALPLAESLLRTFYLLKNLKSANVGNFIAGSMFFKESPLNIYAYSEYIDNNYNIQPYRCYQDKINDRNALKSFLLAITSQLRYSIFNCRRYAGWWYCVIPCYYFKRGEFPVNFFFNGDDIEYSIRLQPHFIALNGICTWHPSFSSKHFAMRQFFSSRNKILIQQVHFQFPLSKFFHFLVKKLYLVFFTNKLSAYIDFIALYEAFKSQIDKLNNNLEYVEKLINMQLSTNLDECKHISWVQRVYILKFLPSLIKNFILKFINKQ